MDPPYRPILSMTNAPTFKLAQWLTDILAPIRKAVSQHTLQDSFDFRVINEAKIVSRHALLIEEKIFKKSHKYISQNGA